MKEERKFLCGYIKIRKFSDMALPSSTQHLIMKKYCEENNFQYKLAEQELIIKNSSLTLFSLIKKLKKNDAIVMCSIHMLPDFLFRKKIYQIILKQKISIHFIYEKFILKNEDDCKSLEEFFILNELISFQNYNDEEYFKNIQIIK